MWTLLLWVPFFAAFGVLILAVLWTPTLLHDNGIPLTQAARAIAFNGLGALIGMGTAGRLIERFGAGPVLVPAFLLGAVTTALPGRRILDRAFHRHGRVRRHRARSADLSDRNPLVRRRLGHGRRPLRSGAGTAFRGLRNRRRMEQRLAVRGAGDLTGSCRAGDHCATRHPGAKRGLGKSGGAGRSRVLTRSSFPGDRHDTELESA